MPRGLSLRTGAQCISAALRQDPMSEITTPPIRRLLPGLQEGRPDRQDYILCRFCHAPVTSHNEQFSVGSSHLYRVVNPHGLRFLIGCYLSAPGCDIVGQPQQEYSWFNGYCWQIARCSDCGEHLGWFYQSGETDQFFGLIVDKLVKLQE